MIKIVVLMVFFSTPGNREPHVEPGFGHKVVKDMNTCLVMRDNLLSYTMKNVIEDGALVTAFCTETTMYGFTEAMEEFKKRIGDLS